MVWVLSQSSRPRRVTVWSVSGWRRGAHCHSFAPGMNRSGRRQISRVSRLSNAMNPRVVSSRRSGRLAPSVEAGPDVPNCHAAQATPPMRSRATAPRSTPTASCDRSRTLPRTAG
jgi:hypothetical protein